MKEKVLYEELTPCEFRKKISECPIAYLPFGTLEWHGEHMPLGADGLQSQGFFEILAQKVGGIVLPMLFLGPDRLDTRDGVEVYGIDIFGGAKGDKNYYEARKLDGSAYWVEDDIFEKIMEALLKQLQRAGFRIVVGHGHGPSTEFFRDHADEWEKKFNLKCFICWGNGCDDDDYGIQTDHGGANETSLVMALRPELVCMENLSHDLEEWPLAVYGKDPRTEASSEVGIKAIELHVECMEGILKAALKEIKE